VFYRIIFGHIHIFILFLKKTYILFDEKPISVGLGGPWVEVIKYGHVLPKVKAKFSGWAGPGLDKLKINNYGRGSARTRPGPARPMDRSSGGIEEEFRW
jgi:hypothetical protein